MAQPVAKQRRSLPSACMLLVVAVATLTVPCARGHALHDVADAAPHIHHKCIHNELLRREASEPVVFGLQTQHSGQPERHIFQMQSAFSNIRINFFFDVDGKGSCQEVGQLVNTQQYTGEATCTADDILTDAKRSYIVDTLMPRAVRYIQSALNVDRIVGNLTLEPFCQDVQLPAGHRSPGVANTDFAVYVTAAPQIAKSQAVAWANWCMLDATTSRPVVGLINFIPSALTNAVKLDQQVVGLDVMTAIHELFHAMGYTANFFGEYVDLNGVRQSDGLKEYYSTALDKVVTKLTFPRALREARLYFGCPEMDGIELEDEGGPGTAGTHWEKRVHNQEVVAGVSSTTRIFVSSFTLAYFEDLGYYTANLAAAQNSLMAFGKDAGCDFVNLRCDAPTVRDNGYCWDQTAKKTCTADLLAGGYCGAKRGISTIPTWQQYFPGQPTTGGSVPLGDFCPTAIAYSNSICISTTNKDTQDIKGNTYLSASRCFESNLMQSDFTDSDPSDTRCFPFSCSITGAILVNVKGQTVRCPSTLAAGPGDTSKLVGFKGTINCPAAAALCAPPGSGLTQEPIQSQPTPQPTPAPPGFTAPPAPVQHTAKLWMNLNMPESCFDRDTCATSNDLAAALPSCRLLAFKLTQCYGTNCNTNLIKWLTDNGLTRLCKNEEEMANTTCIDSYVGVRELCQLTRPSGASARGVGMAVAVVAMALLGALLM